MLSHQGEQKESKSVVAHSTREALIWPECMANFPDGRVCVGQTDNIIIIDPKFDRTTFQATSTVHALSALPNGLLASAHKHSNSIELWDTIQKKRLSTINVTSTPECLTANRNYLICGHSTNSGDGIISFWKIKPKSPSYIEPMPAFEIGTKYPVFALCAFPDGKRLASGHVDGTICLWDINKIDKPVKTFNNVTKNQINSLVPILTDEEYLAVSDLDGDIVLLNLSNAKKEEIGSHASLYTYVTLLPTQQLGYVSKDEIGTYDLTIIANHLKIRKALEKEILPVFFAPGVDKMVLDYYAPSHASGIEKPRQRKA